MTERDEVLSLLDELARLLEGSRATSIEAETEDFSLRVRRDARSGRAVESTAGDRGAPSAPDKLRRVHATTVGIFSSAKDWRKGDDVTSGTVLGAIQSLGHMADITAPTDGRIEEVLVAAGAPVEYGQPLFAITIA